MELATAGITEFVSKLNSVELDRLVCVLNKLMQPPICVLEERYQTTLRRLNDVDKDRNQLTAEQKDLRTVIKALDTEIAQGSEVADLMLMQILLQQQEAVVEAKIAETRPVGLLAQKSKLRKAINHRRSMGRLVAVIDQEARRRNGKS